MSDFAFRDGRFIQYMRLNRIMWTARNRFSSEAQNSRKTLQNPPVARDWKRTLKRTFERPISTFAHD